MLQNADTTGVFQMESAGMRSLIKTLAPDRFEDMMALVALYRPGPLNQGMHTEYAERKHARRKVTYPHPDLEEILSTTYGVMVYQEQIMQIAVRTAGYSMGQADDLRRVMAKKKRELIGLRAREVRGGVSRVRPHRSPRRRSCSTSSSRSPTTGSRPRTHARTATWRIRPRT